MNKTVLILGANGKIGRHAATAFWNAGWTVRIYDRNKNNMAEVAMGADIIVNGLNPPGYKNWSVEIPKITDMVLDAAKHSGAAVIVPGNVYNFATRPGVYDEHTPHDATTRKGRIRIDMEQRYRTAASKGVQTIILRAGSFIDPDGHDDAMGLIHMSDIKKRKLTHMGDPNIRHTYCYLPDWAEAAEKLACKLDDLDMFEDIPFAGHAFTINELKSHLERITGAQFKLNTFPWGLMWFLSPVWTLAYEMLEMKPSWHTSHSMSHDKLARLLPDFRFTDIDTVVTCSLPRDVYPDQSVTTSRVPIAAE